MINFLILGYSDISVRRLIPALSKLNTVDSIDIATESKTVKSFEKLRSCYKSYEDALNNSNSDIVYISLPNSHHFNFAKKSLGKNKNIIIDKPAVLNQDDLNDLRNLASSKNLFTSQSCVFEHHKAWREFKKLSKKYETGILTAKFTIPELDKNNFRMSSQLGGGSINDMGIYATQSGMDFWGSRAKSFSLFDTSENDSSVNSLNQN